MRAKSGLAAGNAQTADISDQLSPCPRAGTLARCPRTGDPNRRGSSYGFTGYEGLSAYHFGAPILLSFLRGPVVRRDNFFVDDRDTNSYVPIEPELRGRMMSFPKTDLYQFAHDFLREHQEAASRVAVKRASTMLRRGDMDGYTKWWRIAKAVEHIQGMERKSDMAA